MRVSFLAPRLPPAVCGIADHTSCLAHAFCQEGVEVGFIHKEPLCSGKADLPAGSVAWWDGSVPGLGRCVHEQQPDWLWIQLSGYGYSRWGAPAKLGRALRALRRLRSDLRVAVCAHEAHCQPRQLGHKGRLLSPWQRHTVGAVTRLADVVFTSIPKYERMIALDYGVAPERVVRLPIGSAIPQKFISDTERANIRRELGWQDGDIVAVTFGSFGTQVRALNACGRYLVQGLELGHLQRVLCIGGQHGPVPPVFSSLPEPLLRPGVLTALGHQSDEKIANVLGSCDIAFSGYPGPLLGKSSAFAAYALAGLPVLAVTSMANESPVPEDWPVIHAESWDWNSVRSPEIQHRGETISHYAQANLRWPLIAQRALTALRAVYQPQEPHLAAYTT